MLPAATLQFLIAMIAYAINERMGRRVEYLQEEVRVLRETVVALTGKSRIPFTADQRRRLAIKGKALTPAERTACCQLVRPATILAWFRQLSARKYDSSRSRNRRGQNKPIDIVKLVIRLANENAGWGYTKIRDALRGLKVEVGRTTVAKILKEAGIEPAPERRKKRTWGHFIKSHWDSLYACDFFSVEVLGVTGTIRYMVFFVMELKSRSVEIAGIRISPDGEWMKQLARNLTDPATGFLRDARYLVHDRDPVYTVGWTAILRTAGVECVPTPAQSPNCNPFAERFVRTIRNECLDHFVIFGERHLRHLIREFVVHYQTERFHQGLEGRIPTASGAASNDNNSDGVIRRRARLGGLLSYYHRRSA